MSFSLAYNPQSEQQLTNIVNDYVWQQGDIKKLLNGSGAIKKSGSSFELWFRCDGNTQRNPLESVSFRWVTDHIEVVAKEEKFNVSSINDLATKLGIRQILRKPPF